MIFGHKTRRLGVLGIATSALLACAPPNVGQNSQQVSASGLRPGQAGFSVVPANAPSAATVHAFAIDVLAGVQSISITRRREFCGYIFVDPLGRLQATPASSGTSRVCELPEPGLGQGIVASYHTHGAYSSFNLSEVPSIADLLSDFNYGIDGYVATPGGRVWHNSARSRQTQQLCGRGCLIADPRFNPQDEPDVRTVYTLQDITRRHSAF